jgi:hypothetical protein
MGTELRLVRLATLLGAAAGAFCTFFMAAPVAAAASCPPPPPLVQPFLPWGDSIRYVPVTNGDFEPIAAGSHAEAWSLSGGASVVAENEPWQPGGSALRLDAGGSATSACTTAPQITSVVRFFVRNVGSAGGELHVELLVNGGKNGILDGGLISADSSWAPSEVMTLPWAKPLKGAVDLRVRLTPVGAGAAFEVDDVYIDPGKSV